MNKIILAILLLVSFNAKSQYLAPLDAKNSGARSVGILVTDSMQNMRFFDTTTCKLAFPSKLAGRIARENGRLYYNPTGTKFVLLDSVVASSAFDTTNIYAQLALRVKYSDTATMLDNYLNSGDIGVSVQGYNASTTIIGNTTSGSGSTILLQGQPTITLPSIAAINVSGGILSLPTGASGTLMRLADTATLSNRINEKVGYTDTAAMLENYATEANLADTSATLRALIGGGGVSAASVAEINTGTDNTKFASALGLEGSKYAEQDGSKNYALTTGTATAYVLTTTPSFTPTTGTILYVRFHLANTGAATINVNGSGAVALQKDLSTALVANDIPINSEYMIRRTSTGWLVTDLGFAGINLSARLSGALSDETGTGVAVFGTSPSFTTSVIGGATFSAFNTVSTNLSLGGAATTYTEGGTPTTALTATYFGNATASGATKTLNYGTGGASGSTTAITLGSNTSGSTTNTKLNITPASDATGDLFYRNASGFLTRLGIGSTGQVLTVAAGLPSWAASGGGGGTDVNAWHNTGDTGTVSKRFGTTGTGTYRHSFFLGADTLLRLGRTSAGVRWAVLNSNNGVANNYDATVIGGETGNASGIRSVVIGGVGGQAQGTNSISMSSGIAESPNSWAWGSNSTYANGANSLAWGGYANNSNFTGCFNWSDFSETSFSSNTANNQFMAKAAGGFAFKTAAATTRMTIKSTGVVNISNTPTYADNTAALAGGLVVGDVYRTSTGVLMITY